MAIAFRCWDWRASAARSGWCAAFAEAIRLDGSALASLAIAGKGRYAPIAADDSDLRVLGVLQSQRIDATDAGGKRGAIAIDEVIGCCRC